MLALDLQPGDAMLDMCAAPGGKTLSALQTLLPHMIVANDVSQSRVRKIHNVIDQFVAGIGQWQDRLHVTERDARYIDDKDLYNKVINYCNKHKRFIIEFLEILSIILFFCRSWWMYHVPQTDMSYIRIKTISLNHREFERDYKYQNCKLLF